MRKLSTLLQYQIQMWRWGMICQMISDPLSLMPINPRMKLRKVKRFVLDVASQVTKLSVVPTLLFAQGVREKGMCLEYVRSCCPGSAFLLCAG